MRRAVLLLLAVVLLGAAFGWACQTSLPPAYQLTDARVLAIRATPPALVPGSSTTLDALVYAPPGSPAPTYAWSWCAAVDASFTCTTTAAALTALLDPGGTNGVSINYDLGTSPTATFAYPASPDLIRAACNQRGDGGADADADADADAEVGDDEDSGDSGDGGTGPLGLRCAGRDSLTIDVLLTVTVGDKTMQSARELTLYTDTQATLNLNPVVLGVAPYATTLDDSGPLADAELGADGSVVDAAAGPIATGGTELVADVPESSSELVTTDFGGMGMDPDAGTTTTQGTYESLTLAWYVVSGQLDHASTTLGAARATDTSRDWNAFLSNRWVPDAPSSQLITVIRDDRGGVGWVVTTIGAP